MCLIVNAFTYRSGAVSSSVGLKTYTNLTEPGYLELRSQWPNWRASPPGPHNQGIAKAEFRGNVLYDRFDTGQVFFSN